MISRASRTRPVVMVAFALAVAPAAWGQTAAGDVARQPALVVAAFETDRTAWMPPPRLGETLAELLTAALASAGRTRIIDPLWLSGSSVDRAAAPDTLFAQAARAGIDYIVLGSVTRLSIERQSSSRAGLLPKPIAVGMIRTQATETVIGLTIRVRRAGDNRPCRGCDIARGRVGHRVEALLKGS